MSRYFFDVLDQGTLSYDYRGHYFACHEAAKEHAELIALDIGFRQDASGEIVVRDPRGTQLFSVAIPKSETMAV